jgi:hypothetical protein
LTTNQLSAAAGSARKLRAAFLGGAYSYYDIAGALRTHLYTRLPPANPNVFGIKETLGGFRLFDAITESSANKHWTDLQ